MTACASYYNSKAYNKDTNNTKEQLSSCPSQSNNIAMSHSLNGPIAPRYCWYPCYMPLDYSRMHMQSYYIHYHPIYLSFASQRPISYNLVKRDTDCSKECEKNIKKIQNIYSRGGVPHVCLTLKRVGCKGCARKSPWNSKRRLYQQSRRP